MYRVLAIVLCVTLAFVCAATTVGGQERQIKVGLGSIGPISPHTVYDIERIIGAEPNIHVIPIQPPGGVDACVRRFVAGEPDDRLDAVMVVSLPSDSFQTEREGNQARFTGTYEIWTLNLSTLAEDRHTFTVSDSETVAGEVSAILSLPAQFISERATGQKLIAGNVWQAYEAVRARVESKLIAATRLYLPNSPLKSVGPLNPYETAQKLIDRGDADTAMAVFRSIGLENPDVQRQIAGAQRQLQHAKASRLLGQTLGALAGGNAVAAGTLLASYEKEAGAEAARVASIRRALGDARAGAGEKEFDRVLRADVPTLDHAGLVTMLTQMFVEETGSAPADVIVSARSVRFQDKDAAAGLKKRLDGYASALGKAAWLMSVKCGCDADAQLSSEVAGAALLVARSGPSFKRPEVGLP